MKFEELIYKLAPLETPFGEIKKTLLKGRALKKHKWEKSRGQFKKPRLLK